MPRKNTRNAAGAGSIRQRPDGRWEARITLGTNPATGKPLRKSIYADTQKEVRQRMTEILGAYDRGELQHTSKVTVTSMKSVAEIDWTLAICKIPCSVSLRPYRR